MVEAWYKERPTAIRHYLGMGSHGTRFRNLIPLSGDDFSVENGNASDRRQTGV